MSALFFFFFLHKNKMKISLVTTAPLLILPVRLLFKFRPVLCPDFMSSLREGVHSIAAARSCRVKKCFPTPFHQLFPMDSVLPETAQGLTAKKKKSFSYPGLESDLPGCRTHAVQGRSGSKPLQRVHECGLQPAPGFAHGSKGDIPAGTCIFVHPLLSFTLELPCVCSL